LCDFPLQLEGKPGYISENTVCIITSQVQYTVVTPLTEQRCSTKFKETLSREMWAMKAYTLGPSYLAQHS
jgi:hypothetical protein